MRRHDTRERPRFALLQKTGKSLMLPVSVLPVAGLLLGIGSAHFTWLPPLLSDVMAQSGGAIFGNLAAHLRHRRRPRRDAERRRRRARGGRRLRRAARDDGRDGRGVRLQAEGHHGHPVDRDGRLRRDRRRQHRRMAVQQVLPDPAAALSWLLCRQALRADRHRAGVHRGRRGILSIVWPPIGRAIDAFSRWAAAGNPGLAFALYGVVERALLPFGLHHIWNVPFFFEVGQYLDPTTGTIIRGEIHRYTAGDPTAGQHGRGLSVQDVGAAGCRASRSGTAPGRRTARRWAAS